MYCKQIAFHKTYARRNCAGHQLIGAVEKKDLVRVNKVTKVQKNIRKVVYKKNTMNTNPKSHIVRAYI